MDACTGGQLPWLVDSPFSPMSGATAEEACNTWANLQGAYVVEARPDACVILPEEGSADEPTSIPVVQVCEPTEDEPDTLTCTTEQPCNVQLTPDQWDKVDGYVGILLAAACVFAVFMGYRAGNIR